MVVKVFCMQALHPIGKNFKGRAATTNESLSPLAENFIMKEFLSKVHPKLPEYIKNTKGHLFTTDRPTLACNKNILIDMMDTLLAELESEETPVSNNISIAQLRNNQFRGGYNNLQSSFRGQKGYYNSRNNSRMPRFSRPPFSTRQQAPLPNQCYNCLESNRLFCKGPHRQ